MQILIQHWDAIELLCKIICKAENRRLEEFYDYDVMENALAYYAINKNGKTLSRFVGRENTIVNLVRKLRTKEPVVLSSKEFNSIINVIGTENSVPVQKLDVIWTPKQKAQRFTGRWWLYYYEEIKSVAGIVRAVMYLQPFNKAVVYSLKSGGGVKEVYTGKYHMSGTQAKYMSIKMHINGTEEKDLQMLFYIGSDSPQIALGQYHNEDGAIYSGTVIIERSIGRGQPNSLFFSFSDYDVDRHKLPPYIWEYFKNKRLNRLRVPSEITNSEDFQSWLDVQQKKKDSTEWR